MHGERQSAAGVLRERGALVRRHLGVPDMEADGQRVGTERALPCCRAGPVIGRTMPFKLDLDWALVTFRVISEPVRIERIEMN
jgi:hypothetical protein